MNEIRKVLAEMRERKVNHGGMSDKTEWVLVPMVPTDEMLAATPWPGCAAGDYARMLAAAPPPPAAEAHGGGEVCAWILAQRDAAEDALGRMFQAVTGRPAEWSSAWDYADAIEEVEEHVAALAQQPAAPSGEAVERWGQSYRCGCFLGFPTKAAIPGHCPQHLRDKNGAPLPLDTAPQHPASVGEEIMVNAAHDVFTLPLQPSGLSSGPRFVVHVPAPEQQPAAEGAKS